MAQFDICTNKNKMSKKEVPFLLDLQASPLSVLNTRIVAPLRKSSDFHDKMVDRIHLPVNIENDEYIAFISEMAAVSAGILGTVKENINSQRTEIISAIDLIFTGF